MGSLAGTKVYLGGAVEHAGVSSWREEISIKLATFGIISLNPLKKPSWMPQIDGTKQLALKSSLLDKGDEVVGSVREENSKVRRFCLALVRDADFLIVTIDKTFTVGTFEEISAAANKPVFIVSEDPIPSMWLIDQLGIYTAKDRQLYLHKNHASCMDKIEYIDFLGPDIRYLDPFSWIFLFNK